MKKTKILPLVFLLLTTCAIGQQQSRTVEDFNFDWKFQLGDTPQAKDTSFDDSDWRLLNLPHDWSIEHPYTTENTSGSMGFLPAGAGWYRKSFTISSEWENSITSIEFDGVYCNSEVWINGYYLGKRPYGYSVFGYELSEHLNYGAQNVIAVKVDHSNFADARWYTGSGIYRNVRLVNTSKVYIPQFGAWVETPVVSKSKAEVAVNAIVKNASQKKLKLTVSIALKDSDNETVAQAKQVISSTNLDTVQKILRITSPKLWSTGETNMYKAEIQILEGKNTKDVYTVDFGMRSIKFDANKGFFLNGESVKLKGVCLHHDAGAVGGIFIRDVWKRRFNRLKEIGVNAIRSSHNPADPQFLALCDEMGFLVINEAFDEWRRNKNKWITSRGTADMLPELKTGYGDIYEEWAERDVKDMVRSSRNHPSIIMWSMGNEIEWTYPYYWKMYKSAQGLGNQVLMEETGDGRDELKETAEEIEAWIKEVDQSRPVTTGGVLPKSGNITGYYDVPDVMGYNYNAKQYDADHETYPDRIMYGSENWGTYQEWKDASERDFIAGIFVWTGIAYLGESGPFPWKGLEISMMDFAGFYTPRGHLFKSLWNDEPHIYLETKEMTKAEWKFENGEFSLIKPKTGMAQWEFEDVDPTWNYNKGDSVFVEVYANSPQVELFVNDKSFGVKNIADFDDHIVKFLVPYSDGAVRAVGLKDGKAETDYELKTAKWMSKIELKADRTSMKANGYDVVHIEAYVTNKAGDIVPNKDIQLKFSVEGAGKNIGVDNGWDRNVHKHKSDFIVTHNGKALLLVQSTREPGEIKISARAGKLKSNNIKIATSKE